MARDGPTILVEQLDEHLEPATADEHLQRLHRRVADRRDKHGSLEPTLCRVLFGRAAKDGVNQRGVSTSEETESNAQGDDDWDPSDQTERLEQADVGDVDLEKERCQLV